MNRRSLFALLLAPLLPVPKLVRDPAFERRARHSRAINHINAYWRSKLTPEMEQRMIDQMRNRLDAMRNTLALSRS